MQTLYVMRHGPAEPAGKHPDAARPLTTVGRGQIELEARVLARVAPDLACVCTSPFVRARQTAESVAAACGGLPIVQVLALASGARTSSMLAALVGQGEAVLMVGHMPDVSELVALCVGGDAAAYGFQPGSVAAIAFGDTPRAASGRLLWLRSPAAMLAVP